MSTPDQQFDRWGHSFEEDHDGVDRPADVDLPRARVEIGPDGSCTDRAVGPGDARPRPGRRRDGRLRVTTPAGQGRAVEVPSPAPDRLELRTGGGA